jgi:trk system potassium uptake protein TrkH
MGLSRYILPVKYQVVYANVCQVVRLLAITMTVPALVAVLSGEYQQALVFVIIGAVAYGLGLTGRVSGRADMSGKEALVVVALGYLIYGFMGAFAFLSHASYLNGFFEAVSGITTTGLSVLKPESLPSSLVFFRSYSQWLGGAGIVVLSLVVLLGPSRNSFRLLTSEFGEEKLVGNVRSTAALVLTVYSILTAAGFLVYLAVGFGPFDALLHVLSTVSTGGFSASSESVGHYGGPVLHLAVAVFMFLGAIGFPAYYLLRRRGLKEFLRDTQLRYLVVLLLGSWILIWTGWRFEGGRLLPSLFTGVSSLTTTGFTTVGQSSWPHSVVLISMVLMLIGGSSGSTAGGLKLYRLIVAVRTVRWYLLKALLPEESRVAIKIRGRAIEDDAIKQTFSLAALYLGLAGLSALCFLVYGGYSVTESLFESVSAIGTVGLSSGITSATMPSFLKLVLIADMWLGRLEILPVLVILYPVIWIPRRSE